VFTTSCLPVFYPPLDKGWRGVAPLFLNTPSPAGCYLGCHVLIVCMSNLWWHRRRRDGLPSLTTASVREAALTPSIIDVLCSFAFLSLRVTCTVPECQAMLMPGAERIQELLSPTWCLNILLSCTRRTLPSTSWSLGDATSTAPSCAATATNSRPSERYWCE